MFLTTRKYSKVIVCKREQLMDGNRDKQIDKFKEFQRNKKNKNLLLLLLYISREN